MPEKCILLKLKKKERKTSKSFQVCLDIVGNYFNYFGSWQTKSLTHDHDPDSGLNCSAWIPICYDHW